MRSPVSIFFGGAVLVGQVVWLMLLLSLVSAMASFLVFSVLSGWPSIDMAVSSVAFIAFFVPVPALIWGVSLAVFSVRGVGLTRGANAGVAMLAALVGVPLFVLAYMALLPVIRAYLDPRFDEFGFLFAFAIIGSIALVGVFPILAVIVRPLAGRLGLGALIPYPQGTTRP